MSSGAFALYIDQAAGGGPGAVVRRVVPLPPTFGSPYITIILRPTDKSSPTV